MGCTKPIFLGLEDLAPSVDEAPERGLLDQFTLDEGEQPLAQGLVVGVADRSLSWLELAGPVLMTGAFLGIVGVPLREM